MQTDNGHSEKIRILGYIILAFFLLLVFRLWQLQILDGSYYRKISEENRLKIVRLAAPRGIIYDRNGIPLVKNSPYFTVSVAPDAFDKLDITALSALLKIDHETLLSKKAFQRKSAYEPIRLKEGIASKEIAYIEARRSEFPGLFIDVELIREYLFGSVGAHLIGYLGKPTQSQTQKPDFRDVPHDSFIGQWGTEGLYDRYLRGVSGKKIIEINALGREIRMLEGTTSQKGQDIRLSMDINLQKEAENAFGERAGALVAIKPDTGEILALVSKPSFDPNIFAKGISPKQWEDLTTNAKRPLLNRALQSQYPPGSTFKIVTAIAGLEENAINEDSKVTCNGGLSYGRWSFGCWQKKGHGTLSLHRAIVESCDVYFYETGRKAGIDKIAYYARELGLGRESGMALVKERSGLIPDTKWKLEKRSQPWYLGETFNAAIGQGYVAVTPFQMAELVNTIANGGDVYKPVLIKINDKPEPASRARLKPETIETVRRALFGVVNENGGTGWAARSSVSQISGKTGTSQVVSMERFKSAPGKYRDHAWFVAFAPFEKPEISLSVMVEHGGHGGSAAAPIAKRAVEAYIKSSRSAASIQPDITLQTSGSLPAALGGQAQNRNIANEGISQ